MNNLMKVMHLGMYYELIHFIIYNRIYYISINSICSDTSFANYGIRKAEDIGKIMENLSSAHWSDRKDGLLGLNNFLHYTDERLNSFQLKRITDIFTRMLVDPHTKVSNSNCN